MGHRVQKRFARTISAQSQLNEAMTSDIKRLKKEASEHEYTISIHSDLISRMTTDQGKLCKLLGDTNDKLFRYISWVNDLKREVMQLQVMLAIFIIVCFVMMGVCIWY